jgi:hypothetical protein
MVSASYSNQKLLNIIGGYHCIQNLLPMSYYARSHDYISTEYVGVRETILSDLALTVLNINNLDSGMRQKGMVLV